MSKERDQAWAEHLAGDCYEDHTYPGCFEAGWDAAIARAKPHESLVYVPGRWTCPKCSYAVGKSILSMADGEVYASKEDGGPCPNDGTQLERVTWREDAKFTTRWGDRLQEELGRQAARNLTLEAALRSAREALAPFIRDSLDPNRILVHRFPAQAQVLAEIDALLD